MYAWFMTGCRGERLEEVWVWRIGSLLFLLPYVFCRSSTEMSSAPTALMNASHLLVDLTACGKGLQSPTEMVRESLGVKKRWDFCSNSFRQRGMSIACLLEGAVGKDKPSLKHTHVSTHARMNPPSLHGQLKGWGWESTGASWFHWWMIV